MDKLSSRAHEWQTSADTELGPNNRVRCIPQGLGSNFPGTVYEGTLSRGEEQAAYQLPGGADSIPGPEVLRSEQEGNHSSPTARQYHCDSFHQQNGGTHSLKLSELAVEI